MLKLEEVKELQYLCFPDHHFFFQIMKTRLIKIQDSECYEYIYTYYGITLGHTLDA